uniref:IAP2 n=1 Tax=Anopheles coluzzii TaxID=1518534 RepID=A0A0D3QC87_ANOCL|nr:IAP2 [Anopheles coluzzii]AJC98416.1 IAP2 [Anopheles coluzzii]AJC98426.1 IAP2 [Anopheles coluzzii]
MSSAGSGSEVQPAEMPYMPEFAVLDARIRSFESWRFGHMQNPTRLAVAGFYYTGTDDEVRCFQCDAGLRDWLVTDDPWQEHARCFAECSFLRLVFGADTVDEVLRNGIAGFKNGANTATTPSATVSGPIDETSSELAQRLREENKRMKQERECKICLTQEADVVFMPCAHLLSCVQCSTGVDNCPVCRAVITHRFRAFIC